MDMPSCHRVASVRPFLETRRAARYPSAWPPFYGGLAAADVLCHPLRRSDLSYDGFRLDSEPIVHGHRSFCLHLRVPLCRLDGDTAEQKLDLIEPDAGGCRPMSTAALTHPRDGHRAHGIRNSAAFRGNLFLILSRHASCTGDCWCDTLLRALR